MSKLDQILGVERTIDQNKIFKLGKEVSNSLGASSLKPSKDELKKVAQDLGISVSQARQALDEFNFGE